MASLRDISKRISSVKGTSKITAAMKMVAAANLRRGQRSLSQARPYFKQVDNMVSNLMQSTGEEYEHPFIGKRDEIKKVGIMVIAGDKGLCGAFNMNVIKATEAFIKDLPNTHPNADYAVMALGNKASAYFSKKHPEKTIKYYRDIYKDIKFATLQAVLNEGIVAYQNGEFDELVLFYTDFVSVMRQKVKHTTILPLTYEVKEAQEVEATNSNYIYEPDKKGILDSVIPLYIDTLFWLNYLSANTAISAARMMAMDNATVNALELIDHLQLQYNKARQESITNEMLEIVSGAEAL